MASKSTLLRRKQKQKGYVKYSNQRMEKFVRHLASGLSPLQAAKKAGYSEKYAQTRLYTTMKTSASFRELVDQYAKHSVGLIQNLYRVNLLPRAFNIDQNILAEMETDPQLAMKHPQTLARVHRIAGSLEDSPTVQMVHINTLNQLQLLQNQELDGLIPDKDSDDEVIEVIDVD
jgi:hypothetical protein